MASTFTTNTGIEKIGDGEQTGQWGQTTNVNFDIVDRALNGVLPIQLFSTAFTLTTSSGGLSDGQAAAVVFSGSIGGPATITIAPDTAQKTYVIRNDSNQPITITQGSGGDVTIPVGSATVVACTGVGATSRVFEAGISQVNLATGVTGTLAIANGGTGTTSTQFTNLTTNVTGTLPVANGGTGRTTLTSGAIVLGNGTGQVGQLVGTTVGQVAQWNGSTWAVESLPAGGVTNVTASAPLASSGGSTPNISLTGTVAVGNGGTGSTSAAGARSNLGLGSMATQNSNSVSISGGSISGVSLPAPTSINTGSAFLAGNLLSVSDGFSLSVVASACGFIIGNNNQGFPNAIIPPNPNTYTLGRTSQVWSTIFLNTAPVVESDQRGKIVMGQTPGLDFITRLNPVQYKLKVGGYDVALIEGTEPPEYNKTVIPGARVHYGFLAQEVKSVVDDLQLDDFAGWVSSDVGNPDAMQSLRYEEFIAPTIKALQEAMARIETLEAQVAALQSPPE